MYAEKEQWFMLLLVGSIVIVSVNVWAAKRDDKMFNSEAYKEYVREQREKPVYKELPVIPFAIEQ